MRRMDREINEGALVEDILHRAKICRMALSINDMPYIVPRCFGYKDKRLYFHCAHEGKKIDILKRNKRVCFEVEVDQELVASEAACTWGMKFRSVVGFGRAFFIDDAESKKLALDIIMRHYSDKRYAYDEDVLSKTLIIEVEIDSMTGKQKGY